MTLSSSSRPSAVVQAATGLSPLALRDLGIPPDLGPEAAVDRIKSLVGAAAWDLALAESSPIRRHTVLLDAATRARSSASQAGAADLSDLEPPRPRPFAAVDVAGLAELSGIAPGLIADAAKQLSAAARASLADLSHGIVSRPSRTLDGAPGSALPPTPHAPKQDTKQAQPASPKPGARSTPADCYAAAAALMPAMQAADPKRGSHREVGPKQGSDEALALRWSLPVENIARSRAAVEGAT